MKYEIMTSKYIVHSIFIYPVEINLSQFYWRRRNLSRAPVGIQLTKAADFASSPTKKIVKTLQCTVLCIVLRHIIIMVVCTSSSSSSSSSELSINQNGASMVKAKDIYFSTIAPSYNSVTKLTIQSTVLCDLS